MQEIFLVYLWRFRHLDPNLVTVSGEPLEVILPGELNTDSGPDFFNARCRIGGTTWAGNVEIHVLSSDWYRHGHHTDPAYDHVILHVVYEDDRPVRRSNGEPIQTLVLKGNFPAVIGERFHRLMSDVRWVPCQNQLGNGETDEFRLWAPSLAVERLEAKAMTIRGLLAECRSDWEETLYRHLASCFGFKVNSLPFEMLARSLPLRIARQQCDNRFRMEALLYGQAGMLSGPFSDPYPEALQKEFHFFRRKYALTPVMTLPWKFLRLRPSNFPTVRISQFAGFLSLTGGQLFNLLEDGRLPCEKDLQGISASPYWDSRFLFDKPSPSRPKTIGMSGAGLLIINGLVPFLYFYGREKGEPATCERALLHLEQIMAERNSLLEKWEVAGIPARNALESQALLQLKPTYCDRKQCLGCRIGTRLLAGAEPLLTGRP